MASNPFPGALEYLIIFFFLNYFSSTNSQYSNVHVHFPNLEQNQVPSPEPTDINHTMTDKAGLLFK